MNAGQSAKPSADTDEYSFLDDGPWQIHADDLVWSRSVPALRLGVAREVPRVTQRRRFPPIGRLAHVTIRVGFAVISWRLVGRRRAGGDRSASRADLARRLRLAAEALGPTYIKLAQIISSGRGVFPDELVDECALCRDQVPAEPFDVIRAVVESDLGCRLEDVFSSFDREPIAAASIAQVHGAELRQVDGPPIPVVVKVQRPEISRLVRADIAVMASVAPFLIGRIPVTALANPPALVELFASTILEELDFRLEASNMIDMAGVFAAVDERGYVVPRPHPRLVTRRVLVMERFDGYQFGDVDVLHDADIDTHELVRIGLRGFTRGCVLHGIFHGDLHGGNLLVLRDGRIGLLDFGICARMTPVERLAFLRLTLAGGNGDVHSQLSALRDLGALPPDTDISTVISELGLDRPPVDPTSLEPEELVAEIQRILTALLGYGARLPKILMLYVKNLIFLDGAIAELAPDLDLIGTFAELLTDLATHDGGALLIELGATHDGPLVDPDSIKAGFGVVDPDVEQLSYRDLKERRDVIRRRLNHRGASSPRRRARGADPSL